MIQKEFQNNSKIPVLKRLIARLKNKKIKEHIQQELAQIEAGDLGEKIVANRLNHYKKSTDIHIFHNVMLYQESFFQMDFVIVTSSCIIIFEVKNISGHIRFTQNPKQLIRKIVDQPEQKFRSPDTQISRYMEQLKIWNYAHQYNIPIYGAIIFPTLTSIVNGESLSTKIIDLNEIEEYIYQMTIKNEANSQITQFMNSLKIENKNYKLLSLGKYYKFQLQDLKTGFLCSECHSEMIRRSMRKWQCSVCSYISKRNILSELEEYFLYFDQPTTKKILQLWLKDVKKSSFYRHWNRIQMEKHYIDGKIVYKIKNIQK